jgi:hypothetical protein
MLINNLLLGSRFTYNPTYQSGFIPWIIPHCINYSDITNIIGEVKCHYPISFPICVTVSIGTALPQSGKSARAQFLIMNWS